MKPWSGTLHALQAAPDVCCLLTQPMALRSANPQHSIHWRERRKTVLMSCPCSRTFAACWPPQLWRPHCTAQQRCGVGTEAGFNRSSGSSFSTASSRLMMAGNCTDTCSKPQLASHRTMQGTLPLRCIDASAAETTLHRQALWRVRGRHGGSASHLGAVLKVGRPALLNQPHQLPWYPGAKPAQNPHTSMHWQPQCIKAATFRFKSARCPSCTANPWERTC